MRTRQPTQQFSPMAATMSQGPSGSVHMQQQFDNNMNSAGRLGQPAAPQNLLGYAPTMSQGPSGPMMQPGMPFGQPGMPAPQSAPLQAMPNSWPSAPQMNGAPYVMSAPPPPTQMTGGQLGPGGQQGGQLDFQMSSGPRNFQMPSAPQMNGVPQMTGGPMAPPMPQGAAGSVQPPVRSSPYKF